MQDFLSNITFVTEKYHHYVENGNLGNQFYFNVNVRRDSL